MERFRVVKPTQFLVDEQFWRDWRLAYWRSRGEAWLSTAPMRSS